MLAPVTTGSHQYDTVLPLKRAVSMVPGVPVCAPSISPPTVSARPMACNRTLGVVAAAVLNFNVTLFVDALYTADFNASFTSSFVPYFPSLPAPSAT